MKKGILTALMLVGIIGSVSAQHDDLYFVPKKKKAKTETQGVKMDQETSLSSSSEVEIASPLAEDSVKTLSVTTFSAKGLPMDADTYNRRGSYLTEQGDAVSEFAMKDEGFVLITEEGDTMWMNTDTLRLTRFDEGEGWVNGFEGSDSDYEYAMRIIRFRNPRYAIPVSSPLYWDVVYGGALWPSWDWNIYDDGMYAYVFPTSSNWYYWDYMMGYPFGWNRWNHWDHHWGFHYSHHWGPHWGMGPYWDGWGFYGHVWYDPWYNPYFYDYHPGWHHGHHGFYPGFGTGKPGWGGVAPGKPQPRENDRHATIASTRRGSQDNNAVSRSATTTTTRRGTSVGRTGEGSSRSSSVRVVTGRTGSSSSRSSGAVRSSSSRSDNDEVMRRGGSTSSSVSRGAATGSSSRSSYTRQSSSRSSSGSSYNRPSSTRSSSSSISRSSSSSSSRSGSSASYSSGSSRSSSSYSSGSSYSSSRSSSSYSGGGSSYGGGGSRGGGSSSSSGGSRGGGGGGSRR